MGTCFPLDSLDAKGGLEIAQGLGDEPPNSICVCLSEVSVGDETASTGEGHQSERAETGDIDGARGFRIGSQLRVICREKSSTGIRFVVIHPFILPDSRGPPLRSEARTTR